VDGTNTTFHKSFVAIANADMDNPFYVATHDSNIDYVWSQIFTKGLYYEKSLTDRVMEVFQEKKKNHEDSIFLDVGANIGWFSLLAAANGATKVYSFEPNLQNTVRFCESLSLNGWSDGGSGYNDYDERVTVIPISKGVGNAEEEKALFAMNNNIGSYTFEKKKGRKQVGKFQITTLDAFAQRHGWFESRPSIGFFKLDVERFELEVLKGAQKLLKSNIVENIEFELKENLADEVKSNMIQLLLEAGYEFYMHGGYMGPRKKVDQVYSNWEYLADDIIKKKFGENVMFRLPVAIRLEAI
jgi:FkbM family methyltransferase